jgi:hypothetical protein
MREQNGDIAGFGYVLFCGIKLLERDSFASGVCCFCLSRPAKTNPQHVQHTTPDGLYDVEFRENEWMREGQREEREGHREEREREIKQRRDQALQQRMRERGEWDST